MNGLFDLLSREFADSNVPEADLHASAEGAIEPISESRRVSEPYSCTYGMIEKRPGFRSAVPLRKLLTVLRRIKYVHCEGDTLDANTEIELTTPTGLNYAKQKWPHHDQSIFHPPPI